MNIFAHVRKSRHAARDGAAVVELALALPVLVMLVMGTLEICELVFLKHSMSIASYEGARLGARKTATAAQVIERCESILSGRRVSGGSVTVSPTSLTGIPRGTEIQVQIRAPLQLNSTTGMVIDRGLEVVQSTTMLRE